MQNQIFNLKRFLTYSKYMLLVNWKKRTLTALTLLVVFISFLSLNLRHWNTGKGIGIGVTFFVISSILIIASAFPGLRTKESSIQYLTIPASNLEKFLAELITRYGLLLLIPYFIKIVGNATIKTYAAIEASKNSLIEAKSYVLYSFELLPLDQKEITFTILIILAIASILFTGASVFKKNPLIKTVLFVGAVTGTIATYFYLLTQKVMHHLVDQNHFFMRTGKLNENEWTNIGIATLIIFSIWSLSYAFFKLKEKEI